MRIGSTLDFIQILRKAGDQAWTSAPKTADLVVKESLQATESTARLLGGGIKNVVALLLALARDLTIRWVGKTNAKRLVGPYPAGGNPHQEGGYGEVSEAGQRSSGCCSFFAQKKGNGRLYQCGVLPELRPQLPTRSWRPWAIPSPQQTQAQEEERQKKRGPALHKRSPQKSADWLDSLETEDAEQRPSVKSAWNI